MALIEPAVLERARNIILRPRAEWQVIDAEASTTGDIYRNYVLPLAAVPPIAGMIGNLLFGISVLGITVRVSPVMAIGAAITSYIMSLVSVFVLALIIDALAPSFGGVKSQVQAVKAAAYSYTAAWLAGALTILPSLAPVAALLSLYGLYLLYLGMPLLMRAAQDKALGYVIVTVVAALLLSIVAGAVVRTVGGIFTPAVPMADASWRTPVPPGATINLADLGAAAREADRIAREGAAATGAGPAVAPVSPASLLALLPSQVGGYQRTEIASSAETAPGADRARAEARYEKGDSRIRLELTDMAGAAARMGVASGSPLHLEASRAAREGYERARYADGKLVAERWNSPAREGSYSELVANRFIISAEGRVADISELRRAAAAIPADELARLAR